MNSHMRDNVFSIIRESFGMTIPPIILTIEDIEELLKFGSRQALLPIFYRTLKTKGIPDFIDEIYSKKYYEVVYRTVQQIDAQKQICVALDAKHIPYILLKGAKIRELYPQKDYRTSSDIDVLVHENDINAAIETIESMTDFVAKERNYHDVSLISNRVHLELHFSIKVKRDEIDRILENVWEHASKQQDSYEYVLTPEFHLFYIIAHMSCHMRLGGLGIRPLIDLWLLRAKSDFDYVQVEEMCAACGLLVFFHKCCNLVEFWMSGEEVDDDLVAFEQACLSGGVFGNATNSAASKIRDGKASRYFLRRAFSKRTWLETEYPKLAERPYLLPYYQAKRWTKIVKKRKRKQVKEELRDVFALDSDKIKSFDDLLDSLGL